jgi:hypothetical protein
MSDSAFFLEVNPSNSEKLWHRSLNVRYEISWLPGIEPSNSPIIAVSSPHRHPDVLVRHFNVNQLPVSIISQSSLGCHIAYPSAAIVDPFLDNRSDELHFLSEFVGLWNSLDHWVDLRPLAICRFAWS